MADGVVEDSIEEVMQQKAPGVPSSLKLHQPQSSGAQVRTKGFSANFFKATFSSRSKAVPAASSTHFVSETTKIGSAETKPITRNRPRTAPQADTSTKVKLKRADPNKPPVKRPDKLTLDFKRPERPKQALTPTPDPGGPKTPKGDPKNDLKSPRVVLQIVKKSHAPPTPSSILPPSLKPKIVDQKLKLTKNINNNDVWTNYETKSLERKKPASIL
ncbi:uncharacterized protein LOC114352576, partial [Ostrinia furnacalis]